uniref:Uncharacterized protein n=1 Tax=Lygus hesperus TaxID=30085 RepID=A0A146LTD8_LYGHE
MRSHSQVIRMRYVVNYHCLFRLLVFSVSPLYTRAIVLIFASSSTSFRKPALHPCHRPHFRLLLHLFPPHGMPEFDDASSKARSKPSQHDHPHVSYRVCHLVNSIQQGVQTVSAHHPTHRGVA